MHGFESVVGPVKGVFDKETSLNKAREHSLLRSDRPAYVTILSLGAPPPPPPSKGWRASVAPGSFAVGTWRVGSCPESQGILGSFQEALQWGHGGHAPAQGHRESLVPSRKLCSGDMEGRLLPRESHGILVFFLGSVLKFKFL